MLIATHTFAASGDSSRRQAAGVASLVGLRNAEIVNVQFAGAPHHVDGVRTLAVLRHSSNSITGRSGPRKPVMSELLDAVAGEAAALDLPYFGFTNADILFTQEAVDWMLDAGKEAYVLSREDFDGRTGEPLKMELAGTDVFAFATRWWPAHRGRFRPYLAGEGGWDNVYTAVVLCHADAAIENRRPLVRHESHPPGPMPSRQFGQYIRMLAAFDAGYFSLWAGYWNALRRLREAGASAEEEARLAREIFVWNPSMFDRGVQAARNLKARARYHSWRVRAGSG